MSNIQFPRDFIWGAATASYQIEGAAKEDGKGESIWDRFSHQPGNVLNGDTGDIACDHYNRYEEDIELMKEIGLKSYRFSISWPRVLPDGQGRINNKGLDFYKRIVDKLLEADIIPQATLYHWDLPQSLQNIGGWANRDIAKYYAEYARIMFKELGDLVPFWITHNEPYVVAFNGHLDGVHAPGLRDYKTALQVAHNLLVSHGLAVKSYREDGFKGDIGITLNLTPVYSSTDSKDDQKAVDYADAFKNRWFLDPLFKGSYPEILQELYQEKFAGINIAEGDLSLISQDIDFLGINYYTRAVVKYDFKRLLKFKEIKPKEKEYTEMGWEIYPQGLYDLLIRLNKEYTKKPLYITENGAAFKDVVSEDKMIHDQRRIEYLKNHLYSAHKIMQEGVPLKGYYAWSLLDNFEWGYGYSKRFGLIYIDYENKEKRILKDSAKWYCEVIKENGF